MTKQKFLERWRKRCPELRVEHVDRADGKHQAWLYPRGRGSLATDSPCRDTAKEVWAAAEDAMLERYGEPCEDERDIRLRQADEFIQRGARRTRQNSCGWYIYITWAWAKGFVAKCPAAQSFSRYHADWIDAVLEIEPAVEKAWAEREGAK